jgi:ubiquinone/menaquinone biosynthesis C-methylase UbiE
MEKGRDPVLDAKSYYNTDAAALYYLAYKHLFPKEKIAFDNIPHNSKILDLGCGTGRTTGILHAAGHEVTGLDISFSMIRAAIKECPETTLLVGDACSLSLKEKQFDVVLFSNKGIDCIYPYEKRIEALQEIERILKPGGLFIFNSHNHCFPRNLDGIIPFLRSLFKKQRHTYIVDTFHSWGATKLFLTTPAFQIEELKQMGFELIKIIPNSILHNVKSLGLIGIVYGNVYYVCKSKTN